jgi:hypothetical protein
MLGSRQGKYTISFSPSSRPSLGATIQWAFSLLVKRPGGEGDHSPLSTAEVKNAWSFAATPSKGKVW